MRPRRQQLFDRMCEPGIRTLTREPFTHERMQRRVVVELLFALRAIQNHQRHAPESLPRNAPVRAFGDHVVDTLFSPRWSPCDKISLLKSRLPYWRSFRLWNSSPTAVKIDEPLLGCAENYGVMAPPTMWIAMRKFSLVNKGSMLP